MLKNENKIKNLEYLEIRRDLIRSFFIKNIKLWNIGKT